MKPTLLALLLASSLAFGQEFKDISKKDSPLSLSIGVYPRDQPPYILAHNNSNKAVLAVVAVSDFRNADGSNPPLTSYQDYAFKLGALKSHEERGVMPILVVDEHFDPAQFKKTVGDGAVLFVQFEDGTTWGDSGVARRLLDSRPQKLAFLKRLVETYYESGETAFEAVLNEPTPEEDSPEWQVAACLRGDAESQKIPPIDLAKKRLADAQGWHASGIF